MNGKSTFTWQCLLIVLPVLFLATAGIVSLRKDHETVTVEARRTAERFGKQLLHLLSAELGASSFPADEPFPDQPGPTIPALWTHGSIVDGDGNLLTVGPHQAPGNYARQPAVSPFSLELLDARAAKLWVTARTAEQGEKNAAISAHQEFIASDPPEPFHSNAQYTHAVLLEASGQTERALDLLRLLEPTSELTETGLPLAVLARFHSLKILSHELRHGRIHPTDFDAAIRDFCSRAIEYPSFATSSLFALATQHVEDFGEEFLLTVQSGQMAWAADENTRAFHKSVQPFPARDEMPEQTFWAQWNGMPYLVLLVEANASVLRTPNAQLFEMRVFPEKVIRRSVRRLLSNTSLQSPPYVEPAVFLEERQITESEPAGEVLATVEETSAVAGSPAGKLRINLHLAAPALLYAQQRQRAFWFGGLIVVAAATGLIGYVTAQNAFRRQLRLNKMKSDFVASVSHELRAPIASVRLMAEGLEHGTVQQPEKQQRYYRFIVQECRRLSALIENVLDFSRIEQDRKFYDIESTDIMELVRHTADLMQPCADERSVRIEVEIEGKSTEPAVEADLDGKAIQQALVNLIDNAIKHSPPKSVVVVGCRLPAEGDRFSLFVEDRGEGIPADEHKRIFERFYRHGSELRRETQGAGIGLSIVKHIVEAHDGTVRLRSRVGEGSRFTIELPLHRTGGSNPKTTI